MKMPIAVLLNAQIDVATFMVSQACNRESWHHGSCWKQNPVCV